MQVRKIIVLACGFNFQVISVTYKLSHYPLPLLFHGVVSEKQAC